jgi:hypothetical protein
MSAAIKASDMTGTRPILMAPSLSQNCNEGLLMVLNMSESLEKVAA